MDAVTWSWILLIVALIAFFVAILATDPKIQAIAFIVLGLILIFWGAIDIIQGFNLFNVQR
jgi:hypothetical protein